MAESVWGPVHADLVDVLAGNPDDVPAVVEQLTQLQDLLVHAERVRGDNPLVDFNGLYLRITTNVLDDLYEGRFADPTFLSRLDVEFANRYFDALRAYSDGDSCCPRVWSVLLARMAGGRCRPLASAAAGVNAHINFDLPFALVTTFDHLGCDPVDGSQQHRDYLHVNAIFAEAIPELRRGYLDRWQVLIDTMNGDLDDWWQGEAVEYTRNVAWRNAQRLWAVRHDLAAVAQHRDRLDGHASTLGRLLMSPLGSVLQ